MRCMFAQRSLQSGEPRPTGRQDPVLIRVVFLPCRELPLPASVDVRLYAVVLKSGRMQRVGHQVYLGSRSCLVCVMMCVKGGLFNAAGFHCFEKKGGLRTPLCQFTSV